MMDTFHVLCATLCIFMCLTYPVTSSDIVFTSTPTSIKPLVTDDLTLRCSLKDSAPSVVIGKRHAQSDLSIDTDPSDVSFVHSIMITKSGADVATVSEHLPAKVFDNTAGVNVRGQVPESGDEKGFLEVIWKYPLSGQNGTYKCTIAGINQQGHIQTYSKSLDVSESLVSLPDVIGYIHKLQITNDLQTAINAKMNAQMATMNSTIGNLTAKLDTHVMYTAALTAHATFSTHNVVVFDTLKSHIGGGYNLTNGEFRCPVAGYYTFDVHILGWKDQYAEVCIQYNGACVSSARAEIHLNRQTASTSANLKLRQGDTVKVISLTTSYLFGSTYGYTSFSGQLISRA